MTNKKVSLRYCSKYCSFSEFQEVFTRGDFKQVFWKFRNIKRYLYLHLRERLWAAVFVKPIKIPSGIKLCLKNSKKIQHLCDEDCFKDLLEKKNIREVLQTLDKSVLETQITSYLKYSIEPLNSKSRLSAEDLKPGFIYLFWAKFTFFKFQVRAKEIVRHQQYCLSLKPGISCCMTKVTYFSTPPTLACRPQKSR